MTSRRDVLKHVIALGIAGMTIPRRIASAQESTGSSSRGAKPKSLRFILDMVHDNPGEPPFVTKFKDTAFLKSWGYTGQSPRYFVQTAITYDKFDAGLLPPGSPTRDWSEKMATEVDGHLKDAKGNQMPLYPFTDVLVVPSTLMQKYGAEMCDGKRLSILNANDATGHAGANQRDF
jgi:hypothetical protein